MLRKRGYKVRRRGHTIPRSRSVGTPEVNQLVRPPSNKTQENEKKLKDQEIQIRKSRFAQLSCEIQRNALSPGYKRDEDHFIPIAKEMWSRGTQVPTIHLKANLAGVSASGSGVVNTTWQCTLGAAINSGNYAAVFDEYRIIHARVKYIPHSPLAYDGASKSRDVVGFVDYATTTAIASKDAGWAHDNAKVFALNMVEHFVMDFAMLPDMEWISTATSNTVFATLKLYADGATNNAAYGELFPELDVQFRNSV